MTRLKTTLDLRTSGHAPGFLRTRFSKLRPDGAAKVLDFGLAKLVDSSTELDGDRGAHFQSDLTQSPTITSPAMTRLGIILGTAAYMSPEQARGLAVDRGTDIWAFGCILFEMLTGARAFGGDDATETIAAIVRAEPEWARLPRDTPDSIRRLLRRCLEKDRRRRVADIRDARLEIDEAEHAPPLVPGVRTATGVRRERLAWSAAVVILAVIALVALARSRMGEPSTLSSEMRLDIAMPPTTDPVSFEVPGVTIRLGGPFTARRTNLAFARVVVAASSTPPPRDVERQVVRMQSS